MGAVQVAQSIPPVGWLLLGAAVGAASARCARRYAPSTAAGHRLGSGRTLTWASSTATAVLFLVVGASGLHLALPAFLVLAAAGVTLALIDLRCLRLPDAVVYPTSVAVLGWLLAVCLVAGDPSRALTVVLGGMLSIAAYLCLHLISPRGLGMGDVKFSGVIGSAMGWWSWPVVVAAPLIAFGGAAAAGVVLLAVSRGRSAELPFGPFMVAGSAVAPLWGERLLGWL